jgi:putative transposase
MSPPRRPDDQAPARLRWARLRFSILGPLLASPPEPGDLARRIGELAARSWKHPTTGEALRFSAKTIERMYYAVRGEADPLRALERKVPKHAGTHPSVSAALAEALELQYRDHPRWSYQLHRDNLAVLVKETPSIGPIVGYATVCRFLKDRGLVRQRPGRRLRDTEGKGGETEAVARETRSYETAHVNALWHLDFHEGKRQVLTTSGKRETPELFGLLDDCSRVCCHAQWYLDGENTEDLVHGFSQGIQKRGTRELCSATEAAR